MEGKKTEGDKFLSFSSCQAHFFLSFSLAVPRCSLCGPRQVEDNIH